MVELIALYLAGLSFFFTGIAGISDNLRQLSGQRFRNLLAQATGGPVRASLLGAVAGTITQSTSVVAFILSGMISGGLLPLERALIVLSCANIGTAALVLIAAVDLHLPILFLIGVCGLLLAFRLFVKWKPGIAALLSVGLVFFGLDMMKQAFKPLGESDALASAARFLKHWPNVAFLMGVVMRSAIHSSAGCAAIILTVEKSGLLSEFPALMAIAGLGLGAAIAMYFLSSSLRGIPRQIAWYQIFSNSIASVLMGLALMVEHQTGLPLLQAQLEKLSPTLTGQIALMFLALNLTIAFVGLAGLRWAPEWLARISPATLEEDLSRPMYVQQDALLSPETAPELVALEQLRIFGAMGSYMNAAREAQAAPLKPLHEAAVALEDEIARFLAMLVKQPLESDLAARILRFQHKQETLHSLEENVYLLADTLRGSDGEGLAGTLVEGLDTILLTAKEALTTHDEMEIDMLVRLTDDRGGMMEQLRNRLRQDNAGHISDVAALHYATTLFERNVWLLRQLALWLREDARLTAA